MHNILLADDHEIVLEGLALILSSVYPVLELDCVTTADDVYNKMQKGKKKYDLLITDIDMPNMSIQELVKWVKISQPECKIIVLSMMSDVIYGPVLYKLGIDGYVNKMESRKVLVNAINLVMTGKKYYSDKIIDNILNKGNDGFADNPLLILSDRESEIVNFLVEGKSVSDICRILNLKSSTVSTHKSRIFEKLGIHNVFELKSIRDIYSTSLT